ncbi:MAG: hypothetical protein E7096_01475 [Bacteroides sp.]|nr:hypothetical protein [Bacteroides sp.]
MRNLAILIAFFLCSCTAKDQVGKPYRGWQKGEMDIHHIYTGHGEANFFIFPDATSMLIDAGDHDPAYEDFPYMNPSMPDKSRRPGEWIARYIARVNPHKDQVDYLMASHFHSDHTGSIHSNGKMTSGRNPDYKLVGLAEVGEWITFGTALDRGYPHYNYPTMINDVHTENYRAFLKHQMENKGLKQEEFKVGKLNQIALRHQPEAYANLFSIRNLAANGEIWQGEAEKTTRYYDLNPANTEGRQNENTKSIAIRIDFGPFSYYTGGDLTGAVKDADGNSVNIEAKTGEACGTVDVCKTNHHSYLDSMHEDFLEAIKAKHYIGCTWDLQHTQPKIFQRMLSKSDCLVFHQYLWPEQMAKHKGEEWTQKVIEQGHIVVKVYDQGQKYKVYILSAEDEQMIVKAIYGPYESAL